MKNGNLFLQKFIIKLALCWKPIILLSEYWFTYSDPHFSFYRGHKKYKRYNKLARPCPKFVKRCIYETAYIEKRGEKKLVKILY